MRWGLNRQARRARLRTGRGAVPSLCPFGDILGSVANLCLLRRTNTARPPLEHDGGPRRDNDGRPRPDYDDRPRRRE